MEIFTTREIVTAVYLAIIIIYVFADKKIRPSVTAVIKAACVKKLLIPFLILLIYACTVVFFLTDLPFWNWAYLKDIIIWVLFAGIPVCFKAVSKTINKYYFRNMITDNLKFTALVEFFTGTFTFNIVVEFILQPVLVLFILLQAVADTKEEYIMVKKLMNWIVSVIVLIIIGFTIRTAIISSSDITAINIIVSFCLPIFFSLLYLPFAHGFAVYAKYELLFIRMSFKEPKDKQKRRKHKLKVIRLCKLSYNKVCKFEREYIKRMYTAMNDTEFNSIIEKFKEEVSH